jgi:hypothetical protein
MTLVLGLHHDARYKSFIQRLKRLHGTLEVVGGGGGRPEAAASPSSAPLAIVRWCLRKACEIHVTMNALTILAVAMLLNVETGLLAARIYTGGMACCAAIVTVMSIGRSLNNSATEQEFAAWYRVPRGHVLTYRDGFWFVEPDPTGPIEPWAASSDAPASRSS